MLRLLLLRLLRLLLVLVVLLLLRLLLLRLLLAVVPMLLLLSSMLVLLLEMLLSVLLVVPRVRRLGWVLRVLLLLLGLVSSRCITGLLPNLVIRGLLMLLLGLLRIDRTTTTIMLLQVLLQLLLCPHTRAAVRRLRLLALSTTIDSIWLLLALSAGCHDLHPAPLATIWLLLICRIIVVLVLLPGGGLINVGGRLALVQEVCSPGRHPSHLLLSLLHHASVRRRGPRLVRGRGVLRRGGRCLARRLAAVRLLIVTTELGQELLHRKRLLV